MLKLGVRGAVMLGKAVWYWGAAVNGEWGAGNDKNMKNGWDPFWSYKNWLASRVYKKKKDHL